MVDVDVVLTENSASIKDHLDDREATENVESVAPSSQHGRKSYTIEKLAVLCKYDELGGNKARVARECGVSRQCVQDWVRDRQRLEQAREE